MFGKGMIFVFYVSCVLERPLFREKKKLFWLFSSLFKEELFSVFSSFVFFVFPYMWFLLQQHEMKVMEDEDGSHVGLPWWSWHE